jgi:hypothetical protein
MGVKGQQLENMPGGRALSQRGQTRRWNKKRKPGFKSKGMEIDGSKQKKRAVWYDLSTMERATIFNPPHEIVVPKETWGMKAGTKK